MGSLLISFFISFIANFLAIRYSHIFSKYTNDWDIAGPQKFHKKIVPRIGGACIFFGLFFAVIFSLIKNTQDTKNLQLFLSTIPAVIIGLSEDLTKKISVKVRLFFTAIASTIAVLFIPIQVLKLDIPFVDYLFVIPFIGTFFSIFAITGLTNAYNIIDGFNGLASMVAMITLVAIGYLGYLVGDQFLVNASLIMIGAIAGFFIWNYPGGLIFLGDGGAYLIGFWIAALCIWLTVNHPQVSPWFALTVNAYPITETLFTIYRRKFHQMKSPGHPDGIHLHSLVYRRLLKANRFCTSYDTFNDNSKTSQYLWFMSSFVTIPAILFWDSTILLFITFILFLASYIFLYIKLVTFKTPNWLKSLAK